MKTTLKYYIKKRDNGQTGLYYIRMGQLSQTAAKRHLKPVHGSNQMLSFNTMEDYSAEIAALRAAGEHVI